MGEDLRLHRRPARHKDKDKDVDGRMNGWMDGWMSEWARGTRRSKPAKIVPLCLCASRASISPDCRRTFVFFALSWCCRGHVTITLLRSRSLYLLPSPSLATTQTLFPILLHWLGRTPTKQTHHHALPNTVHRALTSNQSPTPPSSAPRLTLPPAA